MPRKLNRATPRAYPKSPRTETAAAMMHWAPPRFMPLLPSRWVGCAAIQVSVAGTLGEEAAAVRETLTDFSDALRLAGEASTAHHMQALIADFDFLTRGHARGVQSFGR